MEATRQELLEAKRVAAQQRAELESARGELEARARDLDELSRDVRYYAQQVPSA